MPFGITAELGSASTGIRNLENAGHFHGLGWRDSVDLEQVIYVLVIFREPETLLLKMNKGENGQDMTKTPRILMTGATGFVGAFLAKRLLLENLRVTAAVLEGEETAFLPSGVATVVVPPLSELSVYKAAFQGIDTVIHLAARVHIMQDTAADPLDEFRKVNLHGTVRLARQAAAAGVKRLVFISTVKVHGEETDHPYCELSPLAPSDPYGISKSEAEAALHRIAAETGLEVVIVRPPLVYGAGVKANFLKLMSIIDHGIPLPFASISNKRSLVYVENLVDAVAFSATAANAAGQTYLVSDNDDVSTPELIRRLAGALSRSSRLLPLSPTLMRTAGKMFGKSQSVERLLGSLQVDSSKIRRELGWVPPFTMEQGLKKTALWFKGQGCGVVK
ncbi:UDP-glucose 4-epimerase family protein [Citrifermentans bremense]|uniref:UDP-glucose 4-epimerase family protein n=1 Tax=Citrifermentans bremense TaxID=60035 RepID=UPI001CF77152|nr:SDR family oxidoreductase [Citrifermentans bremense]